MQIQKAGIKFSKNLTKRKTTSEIIIHCSATIDGKPYSVQSMHKDHLKNGWAGIGYNYIIDLDGNIWEGRPENKVGAHCKNHNSKSVGICYVGGLDKNKKPKDTRNTAQLESMEELCRYLHEKYPQATFHGHKEFENKACPCFDVGEWIDTLDLEGKRDVVVEENTQTTEDNMSATGNTKTDNTDNQESNSGSGFLSMLIEFFKSLFSKNA